MGFDLQRILLFMVAFLIGFGFPIWTAWYTWRRGLKSWAIAAVAISVVTFGSVGWLVAILLLIKAREYPVEGKLPSPCPKCGEVTGMVKIAQMDRKSKLEIPRPLAFWARITGEVLVGVCMILVAVLVVTGYVDFTDTSLYDFFGSAVGPIVFLVLLVVAIYDAVRAVQTVQVYRQMDRVKLLKYTCAKCRHQWSEAQEPDAVVIAQPT